jgi:hypothetical protein
MIVNELREAPDIHDEEVLIKHVPVDDIYRGKTPPFVVTSANFELKKDEEGSSVSRLSITSGPLLLCNLKCKVGSRIGWTSVKSVREQGFEVVPVKLPHDEGHAEIRSASKSLSKHPDRRSLSRLFKWYSLDPEPLEVVQVDDSKITNWLLV